MKTDKFLPLGTVVLLKKGNKRIMITGFCVSEINNKDVIYDYCGCFYPEGILSTDKTFLFNHDNIEKIYFFGFVDDEQKNFMVKLNKLIEEKNK